MRGHLWMIPKMKTDEDGGWNWPAEDYNTLCERYPHYHSGRTPYMYTKEWFYKIQSQRSEIQSQRSEIQRLENEIEKLKMKN